MNASPRADALTPAQKRLLFWASFFSLAAAGVGFAFRVAKGGDYGAELGLTNQQVGEVFGASLWPIAITMIGFSLVVDRTGYKLPMFFAFLLQAGSGVGIYFSNSYLTLYLGSLAAGLGHGIVEAVINPVCAAVYPKEKTKWLTILHAAWPAGLVLGTVAVIGGDALGDGMTWRTHALWIVAPSVLYLLMYLPCKFPADERVEAGVPYVEMLRQVGFLTAALASFLMIYEVGNQVAQLSAWTKPDNWFNISLIAGGSVGLAFGFWVRSLGRPLFFLLCLLMIPVATAELGTDTWIKGLMKPVLEDIEINPAMALVFSASIMLVLRVFAGGILKFFTPPTLLCVSGIFSAVGLYWLSSAAGFAVFIAFVLYALGQTYYWPCVLGFTSERYPQGGALTLNTVSAIGLLSAGIIGAPLLGSAFDSTIHAVVSEKAPALREATHDKGSFMWMEHEKIDPEKATAYIENLSEVEQASLKSIYNTTAGEPQGEAQDQAGRDALRYAVRFPAILFIAFGLIALFFMARGGYKPLELKGAGRGEGS